MLLSSVSKTFVGVAAMQAVEAGRVSLDDRADAHLDFAVDNPRVDGDAITLHHLLTHHSGIEDTAPVWNEYAPGDPEEPLADFLEAYLTPDGEHWRRRTFANRAPGEAFSYSNAGMALAALALGQAADLEPADLVDRDIFEPLGMSDTAYYLADLDQEPAVPYDRAGDGFRAWPQYGYPTYPDGMIRSSARDMARYVAAMAGGGELEGVRILSADLTAAMLTVDPTLGSDEDGQAIAWAMRELDGRPLMGHNGGDYGSLTEIWLDPSSGSGSGSGIVLLLNGFPDDFRAGIELEEALFELALDPE